MLSALRGYLKVSRPVIALSLRRIGRATQALYDALKEQSETTDWTEVLPASPQEFPRRRQDQIRSSELGFAYPVLVYEAWQHGIINTLDACDYLNIRAELLNI